MFNKILLCALLAFLYACTGGPAGSPLQLDPTVDIQPLAALFETAIVEQEHGQNRQSVLPWRFWRSAGRIETLDIQNQRGEAWFQSADRQISYERIFHGDKQVIEYMPGDLKALGEEPDWRVLATLLDPAQTKTLRAQGSERVLGRQATRYRGDTKDGSLEIWWLEQERLPALIKQVSAERTQTTTLKDIHPLPEVPWPPERRGNYRYTDFADLGDKESDPFVKSILHQIKGGHIHSH